MTVAVPHRISRARTTCLVVLTTFGLAAAPAQATSRSDGYSASLATPLTQPRQEIVGGVLWKCAEDRCAAPPAGSRPLLVCERLARTFGPVARFATPAGELSADELTRCNANR